MAKTYVPIATQTLGSNAASIVFSSIPATYTDLVLACSMLSANTAGGRYIQIQVGNGSVDTATNYSQTQLRGNGTTADSGRQTSVTEVYFNVTGAYFQSGTVPFIGKAHFMNYSNTTTDKSILLRSDQAEWSTSVTAGLWRSTSAINTIKVFLSADNFAIGTTFTLYGILAA